MRSTRIPDTCAYGTLRPPLLKLKSILVRRARGFYINPLTTKTNEEGKRVVCTAAVVVSTEVWFDVVLLSCCVNLPTWYYYIHVYLKVRSARAIFYINACEYVLYISVHLSKKKVCIRKANGVLNCEYRAWVVGNLFYAIEATKYVQLCVFRIDAGPEVSGWCVERLIR